MKIMYAKPEDLHTRTPDCRGSACTAIVALADHEAEVARLQEGIRKWAQECSGCDGNGERWSGHPDNPDLERCPDCADIHALLHPVPNSGAVTGAYWFCSCRHPNTKVYYADEVDKARAEAERLRQLVAKAMRCLRYECGFKSAHDLADEIHTELNSGVAP